MDFSDNISLEVCKTETNGDASSISRLVQCVLCVLNSGDPTDTAGLEVLIHEQTQLPQVPICNYKMKLC